MTAPGQRRPHLTSADGVEFRDLDGNKLNFHCWT